MVTPPLQTSPGLLPELPEQNEVSRSAAAPDAKPPARRRAAKSPRAAKLVRRINRVSLLVFLFVLLPLLLLCLHALYLADTYAGAMVIDRHDFSTVRVGNTTNRMGIGDTLRGQDKPLLTTDTGTDVTLRLPDSTLWLAPTSQLQIQELGYRNGRVRRLELIRGQMDMDVQPEAGSPGQYAVACHGVTVGTVAGRFRVAAQSNGLSLRVLAGSAWIISGGSKRLLAAGQELTAWKGESLSRPALLSPHDRKLLTQSFPAVEAQTPLIWVQETYLHAQQKTLLPAAARLRSFVRHTL